MYAYADTAADEHRACVELLQTHPGPLFVPVLAIAEAVHFLGRRVGAQAEIRFLGDFVSGTFSTEAVSAADWPRIVELVWRYRDLPLGTVDASVVAAAERLGITRIATLDRRHFSVVRPAHAEAFELLP